MTLFVILQAAMAAGFLALVLYGVFIVLTIIFGSRLLMRMYWKLTNQIEKITNKTPYYKDLFPFLISVIISISVGTFVFWKVIFKLFEDVVFD